MNCECCFLQKDHLRSYFGSIFIQLKQSRAKLGCLECRKPSLCMNRDRLQFSEIFETEKELIQFVPITRGISGFSIAHTL